MRATAPGDSLPNRLKPCNDIAISCAENVPRADLASAGSFVSSARASSHRACFDMPLRRRAMSAGRSVIALEADSAATAFARVERILGSVGWHVLSLNTSLTNAVSENFRLVGGRDDVSGAVEKAQALLEDPLRRSECRGDTRIKLAGRVQRRGTAAGRSSSSFRSRPSISILTVPPSRFDSGATRDTTARA